MENAITNEPTPESLAPGATALTDAVINPDGTISGLIGSAKVVLQTGLDGGVIYQDD